MNEFKLPRIYNWETAHEKIGSSGGSGTVKQTVTKNIVPVGNSISNVGAYLNYGINVISLANITNYALRLPNPPIEGQQVTVVNTSGISLVIYPSLPGGTINGVLNGSETIPSDGKAYTFYCYDNPAPGSWSSPLVTPINTYDSGVITADLTGPVTNVIYASDPARWIESASAGSTSGWAFDSLNQPLFKINNGPPFNFVAFKPSSAWGLIVKATVYTNMTNNTGQTFYLNYGQFNNYYATGTTSPLLTTLNAASVSDAGTLATNVIPGVPVSTPLTPNPGDAGTRWGEVDLSTTPLPQIGDVLTQTAINVAPFGICDEYMSRYLAFIFKPGAVLNGIKFRFILEYL